MPDKVETNINIGQVGEEETSSMTTEMDSPPSNLTKDEQEMMEPEDEWEPTSTENK